MWSIITIAGVLLILLTEAVASGLPTIPDEFIRGPKIYARLVKHQDGWRLVPPFREQPHAGADNEIDILLNDLSPAGPSTLSASIVITCIPIGDCVEERAKKRVPYKTREDAVRGLVTPWSGPFKTEELNIGSTVLNNTLGLIASAGLATGITLKTYKFDLDGYRKALAEAMDAISMTRIRRQAIIEGLIILRNLHTEQARKYDSTLHQVMHDYEKINVDVKFEVDNRSGFREAVESNGGIMILPKTLAPVWPTAPSIPMNRIVQKYLDAGGSNLADLMTEIESEYTFQLEKINQILLAPRRIGFQCRDTGTFRVDYQCPPDIQVGTGGAETIVPLRILAKREVQIGFPIVIGADKAIAVKVGPAGVELTNKTSQFIRVDTLSLYWGGKVSTLSDIKLELAPHTSTEAPLSLSRFNYRFLLDHQPMKISEVIAKDLKQMSIKAGVAVKYVLVDTSVAKTFFTERKVGGAELHAANAPPGWL